MYTLLILTLKLIVCIQLIQGQSYEDARCKCICTMINETQIYKKLYIASVPPNNDCDSVILPPAVGPQLNNKTIEICPRCQCKYESRNTTIIKMYSCLQAFTFGINGPEEVFSSRALIVSDFVVIIVVWVISLLLVYMMFLICLDPLLNNRLRGSNYMEHTNEEDESPNHRNIPSQMNIATSVNTSASLDSGSGVNVLNRVSHQQDKWKRQVQEQRRNIYDRHTMLN